MLVIELSTFIFSSHIMLKRGHHYSVHNIHSFSL